MKIAKAENRKTNAKIKMFTNENRQLTQALKRKVPDDSETTIMPSDSEADVSNEVLQYVSPGGKKKALKRLKLTRPSKSAQKMLQLDRFLISTPERKSSHACAIKES